MNNQSKKYGKILDELVKKSFSELKNEKIFITDFIIFKRFIAQALDFGFFKLLLVNNDKINELLFSKEEMIGLFVHELCHFERYKKKTFLQKAAFILTTWFSKKIRCKDERNTDRLTIKKGYGKELLKIALKREQKYSKEKLAEVYSSGYLSPKEIKQEMKKLK